MKIVSVSAMIAVSLLMGGCGGSGSGGSSPNNTTNEAVVQFNKNSQLNSAATTESFKAEAKRKALLAGDTVRGRDSIVVNGQKINLVGDSGSEHDYNYINDGDIKVLSSGDFLSYSRFAVLAIPGYSSLAIPYFGTPISAENIPQNGEASYSGKGLHILKSNNTVLETSVSAEIDFSDRRGTIKVQGDHVPAFSIDGNIRGNSLVKESNDVALNAKFYGGQAQELTGQYFRADDAGVFGVNKK